METIYIVRDPKYYIKYGEVPVAALEGIRWDRISGGIKRMHRYYSLYAYLYYDEYCDVVDCSTRHADYGNNMKVCIPVSLNKRNGKMDIYNKLAAMAGPKPGSDKPRVKNTRKPCTKEILMKLQEAGGTMARKDMRSHILYEKGFEDMTWYNAIRTLKKTGRMIVTDNNKTFKLPENNS